MKNLFKILILSETLELRFFLETVLAEAGFRVASAGSINEALDQIVRDTPSLILIDVMMSNEQGISIYRQLRRHEKYKSIPVVMLSNLSRKTFFQLHNIEYSRPRQGLSRPEGYLFKPPEAEELIDTIKNILGNQATQNRKGGRPCR